MGEIFALACALVWALAVILFRKSGESVTPFALNIFRVVVSSILFVITMALLNKPIWGQAPLNDYLILMGSGVIAIAVSDTLFHMCLNRVGAGINALVDSFYSPFVVIMAFLFLGERLTLPQIFGMILILGGVVVATKVVPPKGITRKTMTIGILYGVAAMLTLAAGIVMAKPVLEHSDIVWATAIRQLGALAVLIPIAIVDPNRKMTLAVFRPNKSWRFSLPGTLLGSYVALMLWIGGMKMIEAGAAAILNQTSTIYILILATLLLREKFTKRKLFATVLCLAGVVLVILP